MKELNHNKSVEPINYPAGNSSAHFKRYLNIKHKGQKMEKQTESDFINSIINVANEINGHTITSEQKDLIIKKFNELEGTSFERAKKSIENVINKDISKYELVQEDSAASMNN